MQGEAVKDEAFQITLAYALQRALQLVYEVEEQEIAVELIGEGEGRRIILWEAAEGGIGIWERLRNEPAALSEVAAKALELCHFDPKTGEELSGWKDKCGPACYECLLSYSNQLDHRRIDRSKIRDFLVVLTKLRLVEQTGGRTRDEQYGWLSQSVDPASSFEREFLDYLYHNGCRLPDLAQYQPTDEVHVQTDFYYERRGVPGICIFIDGPHHDRPDQAAHDQAVRAELANLGYRVIAIGDQSTIAAQVRQYPDAFGGAETSAGGQLGIS